VYCNDFHPWKQADEKNLSVEIVIHWEGLLLSENAAQFIDINLSVHMYLLAA
jgi:hypothetical protein